jgi:pyridoxamine 5'-phosphate oxidase
LITNIIPETEPFNIFGEWMAKATAAKIIEPNAMALATATPDGKPSIRMVLLKSWDHRGFVFYTNLHSRKAEEIEKNPNVSLCFHWKEIQRQIRIEGNATLVSDEEADEYFKTRPLQSKIGAWASKQSHVLEDPLELERRVLNFGLKFAVNPPARPDFWSGYRITPTAFEFWQDRPFRLHERSCYLKKSKSTGWEKCRLFP